MDPLQNRLKDLRIQEFSNFSDVEFKVTMIRLFTDLKRIIEIQQE